MEPLSAISLVGNVVQFVQFASKLFSEAREIYDSTDGISQATREIKAMSENMVVCAQEIEKLPSSNGQLALTDLSRSCSAVAKELLSSLRKLEAKGNQQGKRTSLRQAFLIIWQKDDIQKLQTRMRDLRSQLMTAVILNMSEQQSSIQKAVDKTGEKAKQRQNAAQQAKSKMNLPTHSENTVLKVSAEAEGLQDTLKDLSRLNQGGQTAQDPAELDTRFVKLTSLMNGAAEYAERIKRKGNILDSLRYERINVRISRVPDAHQKTFSWIFHPNHLPQNDACRNIKFLQWLSKEGGIFWVSGKPGSGKSTFMKYLWQEEKTLRTLQTWAGNEHLVTAKFFFWNGGTDVEKSLEGLFRSLLFELLSQLPDSIPTICQSRWELSEKKLERPGTWDIPELSSAIQKFISQATSGPKYCFFIDGLDEFGGKLNTIIDVLNDFNSCPRIKLCLSSRPWNIFEDSFGRNPDRKLYLQDLTKNDIWTYTRDRLEARMLLVRTPDAATVSTKLTQQIVKRAQGVFLWVYLAVESLCNGVTNGDSPAILQARLQAFPSELKPFYRHILHSVELVYRKQAAVTFQVALKTAEPLLLMTYSFLLEDDPEFSINLPHKMLSDAESEHRLDVARRQLNARCHGLLEPVPNFSPLADSNNYYQYNFEFLHRTARDFILHEDIQNLMSAYIDKGFHVNFPLCRAILAQLKSEPKTTDAEACTKTACKIVALSKQLQQKRGITDVRMLDQVYEVLKQTLDDKLRTHKRGFEIAGSEFLRIAIHGGLVSYIKYKLDDDPSILDLYGKKALLWALDGSEDGEREELIRLLIKRGVVVDKECQRSRGWKANFLEDENSAGSFNGSSSSHCVQGRRERPVATSRGRRAKRRI